MLTLASRCFVAEKIPHDRSLSEYQMSLSGFFLFTSFEKNVDFFGAEWKSTYSGTAISQSRKTALTEIFMFPKTSRNPSNWNQHLHGNSKSETKKTPSHLITKTPWTIIPWILEPGRFFSWYRRQRTQLLRLLLVTFFAKCNLLALEVSARTKPFEVGIFSNTIKKKRLTLQCAWLLRQVVTWSHQRLLSKNRATLSSKFFQVFHGIDVNKVWRFAKEAWHLTNFHARFSSFAHQQLHFRKRRPSFNVFTKVQILSKGIHTLQHSLGGPLERKIRLHLCI